MLSLQPLTRFDDLLEYFYQFNTELTLELAGDADMLAGLPPADLQALLIIGTLWVLYQVQKS